MQRGPGVNGSNQYAAKSAKASHDAFAKVTQKDAAKEANAIANMERGGSGSNQHQSKSAPGRNNKISQEESISRKLSDLSTLGRRLFPQRKRR